MLFGVTCLFWQIMSPRMFLEKKCHFKVFTKMIVKRCFEFFSRNKKKNTIRKSIFFFSSRIHISFIKRIKNNSPSLKLKTLCWKVSKLRFCDSNYYFFWILFMKTYKNIYFLDVRHLFKRMHKENLKISWKMISVDYFFPDADNLILQTKIFKHRMRTH